MFEKSTIGLRSRSRSEEDVAGDTGTTYMDTHLRPSLSLSLSTIEASDLR